MLGAVLDIKAERIKRGMSQQELAEAAGIEQAALSRIESGAVTPRAATLLKIRTALSETGCNENFQCRVHDLDDDSITYYDQRFMPGASNLLQIKIRTGRNAPEIKAGDTAFFDADNIDLNHEGFFLLKFEVDYGVFYSAQDIRNFDYVYLSCLNPMVDNIGFVKKDELTVLGRLVHCGRNY